MKRLLCILVALICVLCFSPAVFATGDSELILKSDAEAAVRGGSFRISVSLGEELGEVSAFRVHLSYDASYLTLTKVERSAFIRSEDYWCRYTADGANFVFASVDRPLSSKSGVCFTLVFDVNEDAAVGNADVLLTMDQIVRGNKLSEEVKAAGYSIEMERILSSEALLAELKPSTGTLTPNFSPEVTEYTMTVPYEAKELTFETKAKDSGTVRVNRKNLNKVGEATTYIVKVTSEDGKSVTEYVITATRQPKEVVSLSSEALLTKLKPSTGTLTPNFSPEVTEYTMTVPYEVKALTFETKAKDGGTVRVNRKNLNKAGEATTYIVKVTSKDGKSVTEYVITATRQPKKVVSSSSFAGTTGTIGRVPSSSSSRRSSTASTGRWTGGTSGKESTSSSGSSTGKSDGVAHEAAETGNKTVIVNGNRNIYNNSNPYMAYGVGILVGAGTLAAVVVILYGRKRSHAGKHRDSNSDLK